MNKNAHCWVVNITNRTLFIHDLGLQIAPNSTMDLLGIKNENLSIDQVQNSINSGSLYNLRNEVCACKPPLPRNFEKKVAVYKEGFPRICKTAVKIEEKIYKELEIDSEELEFSNENAEASALENMPNFDFDEDEDKKSSNKNG